MTTATPNPIERLDTPLGALVADVARLAEQRLRDGRLAEQRHQLLDPAEPPLACAPPEEDQ